MVRPRNGSSPDVPYLMAPSLALIPYSVTIARAIAVAFSMSLPALVVAGGQECRLVDHVCQVGAGEPGGTPGEGVQVDVWRERLALRVYSKNGLTALHVRPVDGDLAVEAAGAQQRRVEDVRTVRRGDEDDAALGVEPVHLDEQLVEGLLALVVPTAEARAPVAADRVDLVDEDDGRRVRLGLLEQVTDPGGADTDEHLDEVRAGDRVERHRGLAGDRAREERLAGAGRAVEQHALRDLRAQGLVLPRALQEVLDLVELLDGLIGPGYVGERGLRRVLGDQLRLGLAEVEHPRAAALHLRHEEQEQQHQYADRQQVDQQADEDALLGDLRVQRIDLAVVHELLGVVEDLVHGVRGHLRLDLVGAVERGLQVQADGLLLVLEQHTLDVARVELLEHDRGVDLLVAGASGEQQAQRDRAANHQEDPDHRPAKETGTFHPVVGRSTPGPS